MLVATFNRTRIAATPISPAKRAPRNDVVVSLKGSICRPTHNTSTRTPNKKSDVISVSRDRVVLAIWALVPSCIGGTTPLNNWTPLYPESGRLDARSASLHPLHSRRLRNNPRLVPHIEQSPHGFATVVAVV